MYCPKFSRLTFLKINVNESDARNWVSHAPDDEGVQGTPLFSQVVVVAVQHQAVPVPPGGSSILTNMA